MSDLLELIDLIFGNFWVKLTTALGTAVTGTATASAASSAAVGYGVILGIVATCFGIILTVLLIINAWLDIRAKLRRSAQHQSPPHTRK